MLLTAVVWKNRLRKASIHKEDRGFLQLYSNKGRECSRAHCSSILPLEISEGQPPFLLNSWLHVALFLSPLADVPGRYNLPKLPTTYSLFNLSFYPEVLTFRLVQTHLSVSGDNLLLELSRDTKPHFKDANTYTFTHGIVCKEIPIHFPYCNEQGLFAGLLLCCFFGCETEMRLYFV